MSNDYRNVQKALKDGADPLMLCQTCPWDRHCVNPPTTTADDIEKKMKEAEAKDEAKDKDHAGLPMAMMLTALAFGGKDLTAEICPVLGVRLRSSRGRDIVDALKKSMQAFVDDEAN